MIVKIFGYKELSVEDFQATVDGLDYTFTKAGWELIDVSFDSDGSANIYFAKSRPRPISGSTIPLSSEELDEINEIRFQYRISFPFNNLAFVG